MRVAAPNAVAGAMSHAASTATAAPADAPASLARHLIAQGRRGTELPPKMSPEPGYETTTSMCGDYRAPLEP